MPPIYEDMAVNHELWKRDTALAYLEDWHNKNYNDFSYWTVHQLYTLWADNEVPPEIKAWVELNSESLTSETVPLARYEQMSYLHDNLGKDNTTKLRYDVTSAADFFFSDASHPRIKLQLLQQLVNNPSLYEYDEHEIAIILNVFILKTNSLSTFLNLMLQTKSFWNPAFIFKSLLPAMDESYSKLLPSYKDQVHLLFQEMKQQVLQQLCEMYNLDPDLPADWVWELLKT